MIDRIMLDMDGVLADFVGGVCGILGRDRELIYKTWPSGNYSAHVPLGLPSENQMWKMVDKCGPDFWFGLPRYPWALDIMDRLKEFAPVTILTSPSRHPNSAYGKIDWLLSHFGAHFRDYILAPKKWLLARPGFLLLDDCDENCIKWSNHNGCAIVFPQPWNIIGHKADPVEYVMQHVARHASEPPTGP